MGGSESKVNILNQRIQTRYDKLNIKDTDRVLNIYFTI
jgi:hypothetical protein